jgi:hypothetical protein
MTIDRDLLDPTAELSPVIRPRIARPGTMAGRTFGLLDIAKKRGDVFLDRIDELLRGRGHDVRRYRKQRFSIIAPPDLRREISEDCDYVIEALAD